MRYEPTVEFDSIERAATPEGRLEDALELLQELPPAQAEVIALRVIVGFSADEVGEMTGRSAGPVRVMTHRALTRLRELMEEPVSRKSQSSESPVTGDLPGSMDSVT